MDDLKRDSIINDIISTIEHLETLGIGLTESDYFDNVISDYSNFCDDYGKVTVSEYKSIVTAALGACGYDIEF